MSKRRRRSARDEPDASEAVRHGRASHLVALLEHVVGWGQKDGASALAVALGGDVKPGELVRVGSGDVSSDGVLTMHELACEEHRRPLVLASMKFACRGGRSMELLHGSRDRSHPLPCAYGSVSGSSPIRLHPAERPSHRLEGAVDVCVIRGPGHPLGASQN